MGSLSYISAGWDELFDLTIKLFEIQFSYFELCRLDSAANVDSDQVGYDFVMNCHGRSDGAARTCMHIRHHSDLGSLRERLIDQCHDLFFRTGFHIIRVDDGFVVASLDLNNLTFLSLAFFFTIAY